MAESSPKAPETWRCEAHGLDVPVRAYAVMDHRGTYREACPECAREAQERARIAQEESEAREAEQAKLRRRENARIPIRYHAASLAGNGGPAGRLVALLDPHGPKLGTGAILLGPPGTGKTYAACAILGAWADVRRRVAYATAREVIRRFKGAWKRDAEETEDGAMADYAALDLLAMDELGADSGSDFEVGLLTDVINARYADHRPTILVSNLTPEEFTTTYGDRVADRFREGGEVLLFTGPSRRGAQA